VLRKSAGFAWLRKNLHINYQPRGSGNLELFFVALDSVPFEPEFEYSQNPYAFKLIKQVKPTGE